MDSEANLKHTLTRVWDDGIQNIHDNQYCILLIKAVVIIVLSPLKSICNHPNSVFTMKKNHTDGVNNTTSEHSL